MDRERRIHGDLAKRRHISFGGGHTGPMVDVAVVVVNPAAKLFPDTRTGSAANICIPVVLIRQSRECDLEVGFRSRRPSQMRVDDRRFAASIGRFEIFEKFVFAVVVYNKQDVGNGRDLKLVSVQVDSRCVRRERARRAAPVGIRLENYRARRFVGDDSRKCRSRRIGATPVRGIGDFAVVRSARPGGGYGRRGKDGACRELAAPRVGVELAGDSVEHAGLVVGAAFHWNEIAHRDFVLAHNAPIYPRLALETGRTIVVHREKKIRAPEIAPHFDRSPRERLAVDVAFGVDRSVQMNEERRIDGIRPAGKLVFGISDARIMVIAMHPCAKAPAVVILRTPAVVGIPGA